MLLIDRIIGLPGAENGWLLLLAETTLKGTLLLLCAVALTFALRRARASVRHQVWSFALIAMMAVPMVSIVIPHWSLPLLPLPGNAASALTSVGARTTIQAASDRLPATTPITIPVAPAGRDRVPIVAVTLPEQPAAERSISGILAQVWLFGFLVCLAVVAFGLFGLHRLAHRATRIANPQWLTLLASLKRELALDREIVLLRSPEATMPATWGVRNPVVLLPFEAMEWTEERKRVVLLHELAHVKRHDCLTQFVAQLCSAVYWFHPGVWYIARRMRAERELACDEQVLVLGINACDYADHLLQITRAFRSPVGARMAAVAMARRSQLEGRLLAILSGDTEGKKSVSNASRVAVFAVLLAVTLPLAAMRPWKNSPAVAQGSPSGGIVLPRLRSAELPASMQSVSDTLRWRGRSFQGQWIEIHANVGDIRAVLTDGNEPWVRAVRKTPGRIGETYRINVDRKRSGFSVCVLPTSSRPKSCVDAFKKNDSGSGVRFDFLVGVPTNVGFAGHTVTGNISAERLEGYARGTASTGDISIETTDLAEASTHSGSISVSFGRSNWTENLEFETRSGDVTVIAPGNASAAVQAETNVGRVKSDFPLGTWDNGAGEHRRGRIGTGSRGMLTLRTGRGNVELRRGAAGAAAANIYGDAPSSSGDPKPLPNPGPDVDREQTPRPVEPPRRASQDSTRTPLELNREAAQLLRQAQELHREAARRQRQAFERLVPESVIRNAIAAHYPSAFTGGMGPHPFLWFLADGKGGVIRTATGRDGLSRWSYAYLRDSMPSFLLNMSPTRRAEVEANGIEYLDAAAARRKFPNVLHLSADDAIVTVMTSVKGSPIGVAWVQLAPRSSP